MKKYAWLIVSCLSISTSWGAGIPKCPTIEEFVRNPSTQFEEFNEGLKTHIQADLADILQAFKFTDYDSINITPVRTSLQHMFGGPYTHVHLYFKYSVGFSARDIEFVGGGVTSAAITQETSYDRYGEVTQVLCKVTATGADTQIVLSNRRTDRYVASRLSGQTPWAYTFQLL